MEGVSIIADMQYTTYRGNANLLSATKHKSARDFALDTLRRAIVEGQLLPGQELDEYELADQMGISRTPVREAIQILEVQGFVVHRRFSKPVVSPISVEQIEEVYMVRKALEGIAIYQAALNISAKELQRLKRLLIEEAQAIEQGDDLLWSRCNRRFHTVLYAASGKSFLCRYIDWLLDLSTLYMITAAKFINQRLKESNKEHVQIIHACEERNPELAQGLIEEHLGKSAVLLVEYVRSETYGRQQQ